ncbi:MAG TPA: hypothetical protein VI072_14625 [Polyangiaceae bacterium]
MRHSSTSNYQPLERMPVVSVESRHFVSDPVRTRMGVGEAFIDHAAGMPRSARRPSLTPFATQSVAYAPASGRPVDSREYAERRNYGEAAPQFAFTDEPVDLPLRSPTKSYVMMGAVIVAFLAVFLTVALSGGRVAPPSDAPGEVTAPPARAAAQPAQR